MQQSYQKEKKQNGKEKTRLRYKKEALQVTVQEVKHTGVQTSVEAIK